MDVLLWRKDEFDAHYNCSFFDVNTVPFEKRQHILLGLAYIAAFIVYEVCRSVKYVLSRVNKL